MLAQFRPSACHAMSTKTLRPWSKDKAFVAVSLNIGGRNTNPLEFLLDGDSSKEGASATKARLRAQEGMVDAECGPARMTSTERAIVDEIMSSLDSKQDVHVTALHQTFTFGPFSAVSTPKTARVGSFFSSFEIYQIYICVFGEKRTEIEHEIIKNIQKLC